MLLAPGAHELGGRGEVAQGAVEARLVGGGGGAAVAGPDRVHEHQIGGRQQSGGRTQTGGRRRGERHRGQSTSSRPGRRLPDYRATAGRHPDTRAILRLTVYSWLAPAAGSMLIVPVQGLPSWPAKRQVR